MMGQLFNGLKAINSKKGMEMVQVAILVAIAVAIGLLFKDRIIDFVNAKFDVLDDATFSDYSGF